MRKRNITAENARAINVISPCHEKAAGKTESRIAEKGRGRCPQRPAGD